MSVVLVIHVIAMLDRAMAARLPVRVTGMVRMLAVSASVTLVPVRFVLGVRVAFMEVIGMAAVLHGGVPTVRAVAVPGVFAVLAVCRLSHGLLPDPFLNVANGVFGDVAHMVVVQ
jgi:hypothetical protein